MVLLGGTVAPLKALQRFLCANMLLVKLTNSRHLRVLPECACSPSGPNLSQHPPGSGMRVSSWGFQASFWVRVHYNVCMLVCVCTFG